jgi:acylphosphatase
MTGPEDSGTGIICRRLRIRGRVQGVGYRDWAMRAARAQGLNGWIRNRSDGSVEALVCGEAGAVESFVEASREGPVAARVDAIDRQVETEVAPEGFTMLPTI